MLLELMASVKQRRPSVPSGEGLSGTKPLTRLSKSMMAAVWPSGQKSKSFSSRHSLMSETAPEPWRSISSLLTPVAPKSMTCLAPLGMMGYCAWKIVPFMPIAVMSPTWLSVSRSVICGMLTFLKKFRNPGSSKKNSKRPPWTSSSGSLLSKSSVMMSTLPSSSCARSKSSPVGLSVSKTMPAPTAPSRYRVVRSLTHASSKVRSALKMPLASSPGQSSPSVPPEAPPGGFSGMLPL
mmetsp:Transcript_18414/g.56266  ORF Transcript_18414/g.56266 Transcript_18414/m.56266 type:complete len:237 (+) Transcript_18414:985-1695(+)